MNREVRESIFRIVFSAAFILVGLCSMGHAAKPNIIYVMLDDAGYGDFTSFGSEHLHTPTMEQMCREGLKFTNHYSGSAVCAPTRCVLMTGLHTGHCRRRDNVAKANKQKADVPRGLVFLKPEDITVAESLQSAGYETVGIGKWGLGNPGTTAIPEKHGFDWWYGYLDQVHAHNHFTKELWDHGKMTPIPANANGDKGVYVHDLFEQRTLDFLKAKHEKPFFLYLAYTLPHGKYEIPQESKAYKNYADKPWPQQVKNYAAMVTRADETVGKILDTLDSTGLSKDTVVFYTSDNGPNRPFIKPLNSAGKLRGTKRMLYEGGIRAPMAVRWPGKVAAGGTSDFVWDMRDFFPTACELAGAKPLGNLDGISIVPTLMGKSQPEHPHMYWEIHSPFQQAVRMNQYKAIRFGTAEPVQLFDLKTDVSESTDVSDRHPDVVARITTIMNSSRTQSEFWPAQTKSKARGRRNKNQ